MNEGLAVYNELDAFRAEWLSNLIDNGLIARGTVLHGSILDLDPEHVAGVAQAHFFAGIGVWSHALRLAGWPDNAPVWTGSCPCQPFSAAGRRKGFADDRHLWPVWFELIRACRPVCILGEQVAGPDGLAWLDLVQADLEGAGYAFRAVDLCAAGVGAPQIRQRLYWVALAQGMGEPDRQRREGLRLHLRQRGSRPAVLQAAGRGEAGGVGGAGILGAGRDAGAGAGAQAESDRRWGAVRASGDALGASGAACGGGAVDGATRGFWRGADWLYCRDDRWRPTQPGLFPLATRTPARVGRVSAYGDAIVAPLAALFIEEVIACLTT